MTVFLPRKLSVIEERDRFFDILQEVAPTCPPVLDSVITDQVYVVSTSFKKWHRATIGSSCGTHQVYLYNIYIIYLSDHLKFFVYQVGNGPSEPLYKCFLLDVPLDDRVPKSSIRVLPQNLMDHPPFAPKRLIITQQIIGDSTYIKSSSPLEIPSDVPENTIKAGSIISDSIEPLEAHIIKKYKPKFSRLDLKFSPIHYASVIISKALHPRAVYVRIDDDEVPLFRRMNNELQQEFGTATPGSYSFCSLPLIGPYFNLLIHTIIHN